MKQKANKAPRRGTAWSEVSNIDFGAYQVKQNRFAKRVKKEGILLVHDGPSPASLKASPEADFARVKGRRSNHLALAFLNLNCAGAQFIQTSAITSTCAALSGSLLPVRRPFRRRSTMFTIECQINLPASLPSVRTAITTEAGYRAWFAQDADFDGKLATFRFARPEETRSVTLQVVHEDAQSIVMSCVGHENNPDWVGATLALELQEAASGTRLRLVHSGYPAMNEVYERCVIAWRYFLDSLASYLTTGKGQPYPKGA